MSDYIQELEKQNEELQQMLADAQLELVNARKKLAKKNAMMTGLDLAEKYRYNEKKKMRKITKLIREEFPAIVSVFIGLLIVGGLAWGMSISVEIAKERNAQQESIKRLEQRIVNARAAARANKIKVEQ